MKYTLLRLGLFAAALVVLALLGAGGWLLVLLAAVTSLALSLVLLRGPREEVSVALARRAEASAQRRRARAERRGDQDAAIEDAAVDAARDDQPDRGA